MKHSSVLIATAAVGPALVMSANANVLCVNPGGTQGCFATIQAAVNAAANLDTIQIAAGKYSEKVLMNGQSSDDCSKSLLIQGAGADKTIVDGSNLTPTNGPVFKFQFDCTNQPTATLSDMTIRGGYRGVDAGRYINLTLRNVLVRDNGPGSGAGVYNDASFVTIIGSTITNNTAADTYWGCDGSGGTGGGIAKLCGGGSYTIINSAVTYNTTTNAAAA